MNEIAKKNMLFRGDGNRRVPRHCVGELKKKTFFIVGKMLALSLMHGGPAPTFLADSIVNYILHGNTDGKVTDVPDQSVQDVLLKVHVLWLCPIYNGMHVSTSKFLTDSSLLYSVSLSVDTIASWLT